MQREASCRCGELRAVCEGAPVRISVCHCLACQRRSGSAFAVQARWPNGQVALSGEYREWTRITDSGRKAVYRFCPSCGSTITYRNEGWEGVTAVPVGAFADPDFPAPGFSVYEHRKHRWLEITGEGIDHSADPDTVIPDLGDADRQ